MKYFTKDNSPVFEVSDERWKANKHFFLKEDYFLVDKPKDEKAEKPQKSVAPPKK